MSFGTFSSRKDFPCHTMAVRKQVFTSTRVVAQVIVELFEQYAGACMLASTFWARPIAGTPRIWHCRDYVPKEKNTSPSLFILTPPVVNPTIVRATTLRSSLFQSRRKHFKETFVKVWSRAHHCNISFFLSNGGCMECPGYPTAQSHQVNE